MIGRRSENPGITKERCNKSDIDKQINDTGEICARSFAYPLTFYQPSGHISVCDERLGNRYATLWSQGTNWNRFTQSKYNERNDGENVYGSSDECAILHLAATTAIRSLEHHRIAFNVCCLGLMTGRGNLGLLREALADLSGKLVFH